MPNTQATCDDSAARLQGQLGLSEAALACEDHQDRIVLWTHGATRLLGKPADDMLGEGLTVLCAPASAAIRATRAAVRAGGFGTLTGIPFDSLDGPGVAVDLLATPLPLRNGSSGILWHLIAALPRPAPATSTNHDELTLQRNLIETIPIPVFIKNNQGRYTAFNRAWEDFFGRRREEWLGHNVAEKFPPDVARGHQAQDERLMRSGGMLEWEDELRSSRGDATPVIYRKTALRDTHGRSAGVIGTILDVTRLRLAESRFRQVVEMAPEALIVCDPGGYIRLVNAKTEKLFGYSRADLMNMTIEQLLPERFRTGHTSYRGAYSRDPVSRSMGQGRNLYARRRDGAEIPVEVSLGPLPSDDEEWVIAVIADISARVAAQRQIEASLVEKTVLLNEVHHRVKNNLQVIGSLLNLQAGSSQDERVRAALKEAMGRVRGIGLMHELLYERSDFSTIDLGTYMERLTRLVRGAYSAERERIAFSLTLESVPVTMGQAMHCGLIANELLTNAMKHAFPPPARGRIEVELKQISPGTILFAVSDDGIGFEPDLHADSAGTLGMRLIQMLTDQIDGRLRVVHHESERQSIRFELTFPANRRDHRHEQR